ncbi:Fer-1-like protein 6 [Porphyridium purpureum]|uniref:Fer-1-like protein 6 n=1 Tax=Porphyridium purpureum TaxID=35688 RepID=A0A5J4YPJ4_PORPP|nr:Fer-1-like protein 6 [Porphyridium purpureum]|eukprot:POR2710..scf295_9
MDMDDRIQAAAGDEDEAVFSDARTHWTQCSAEGGGSGARQQSEREHPLVHDERWRALARAEWMYEQPRTNVAAEKYNGYVHKYALVRALMHGMRALQLGVQNVATQPARNVQSKAERRTGQASSASRQLSRVLDTRHVSTDIHDPAVLEIRADQVEQLLLQTRIRDLQSRRVVVAQAGKNAVDSPLNTPFLLFIFPVFPLIVLVCQYVAQSLLPYVHAILNFVLSARGAATLLSALLTLLLCLYFAWPSLHEVQGLEALVLCVDIAVLQAELTGLQLSKKIAKDLHLEHLRDRVRSFLFRLLETMDEVLWNRLQVRVLDRLRAYWLGLTRIPFDYNEVFGSNKVPSSILVSDDDRSSPSFDDGARERERQGLMLDASNEQTEGSDRATIASNPGGDSTTHVLVEKPFRLELTLHSVKRVARSSCIVLWLHIYDPESRSVLSRSTLASLSLEEDASGVEQWCAKFGGGSVHAQTGVKARTVTQPFQKIGFDFFLIFYPQRTVTDMIHRFDDKQVEVILYGIESPPVFASSTIPDLDKQNHKQQQQQHLAMRTNVNQDAYHDQEQRAKHINLAQSSAMVLGRSKLSLKALLRESLKRDEESSGFRNLNPVDIFLPLKPDAFRDEHYFSGILHASAKLTPLSYVSHSYMDTSMVSLREEWSLRVTLLELRHMVALDQTNTSDPFVTVTAFGQTKRSHTYVKTLSCALDETLYFVDVKSRADLLSEVLVIHVKDWNRLGMGDKMIGSVVFQLSSLLGSGQVVGWYELRLPGVEHGGIRGYIKFNVELMLSDAVGGQARSKGTNTESQGVLQQAHLSASQILPVHDAEQSSQNMAREEERVKVNGGLRELSLSRPVCMISTWNVTLTLRTVDMLPSMDAFSHTDRDIVRCFANVVQPCAKDVKTRTVIAKASLPRDFIKDVDPDAPFRFRRNRKLDLCTDVIIPVTFYDGHLAQDRIRIEIMHRTLRRAEKNRKVFIGYLDMDLLALFSASLDCVVCDRSASRVEEAERGAKSGGSSGIKQEIESITQVDARSCHIAFQSSRWHMLQIPPSTSEQPPRTPETEFRGRVLAGLIAEPADGPLLRENSRKPKKKNQGRASILHVRRSKIVLARPQIRLYELSLRLHRATELSLPNGASIFTFCTMGLIEFGDKIPNVTVQNGCCSWLHNSETMLRGLQFPADVSQIPDLFIFLRAKDTSSDAGFLLDVSGPKVDSEAVVMNLMRYVDAVDSVLQSELKSIAITADKVEQVTDEFENELFGESIPSAAAPPGMPKERQNLHDFAMLRIPVTHLIGSTGTHPRWMLMDKYGMWSESLNTNASSILVSARLRPAEDSYLQTRLQVVKEHAGSSHAFKFIHESVHKDLGIVEPSADEHDGASVRGSEQDGSRLAADKSGTDNDSGAGSISGSHTDTEEFFSLDEHGSEELCWQDSREDEQADVELRLMREAANVRESTAIARRFLENVEQDVPDHLDDDQVAPSNLHSPVEVEPHQIAEQESTRKLVQSMDLMRSYMLTPGRLKDEHFELRAHIIEGRQLPTADPNGLSDPFVKISMGDCMAKGSVICRQTLNPVWGETLVLPKVSFRAGEPWPDLHVFIYDWDEDGLSDFLGRATVPWYELRDTPWDVSRAKWYPVFASNPEFIVGEISAAFQFVRHDDASSAGLRLLKPVRPKFETSVLQLSLFSVMDARISPYQTASMFLKVQLSGEGALALRTSRVPIIPVSESSINASLMEVLLIPLQVPDLDAYAPSLNIILCTQNSKGTRTEHAAAASISLSHFLRNIDRDVLEMNEIMSNDFGKSAGLPDYFRSKYRFKAGTTAMSAPVEHGIDASILLGENSKNDSAAAAQASLHEMSVGSERALGRGPDSGTSSTRVMGWNPDAETRVTWKQRGWVQGKMAGVAKTFLRPFVVARDHCKRMTRSAVNATCDSIPVVTDRLGIEHVSTDSCKIVTESGIDMTQSSSDTTLTMRSERGFCDGNLEDDLVWPAFVKQPLQRGDNRAVRFGSESIASMQGTSGNRLITNGARRELRVVASESVSGEETDLGSKQEVGQLRMRVDAINMGESTPLAWQKCRLAALRAFHKSFPAATVVVRVYVLRGLNLQYTGATCNPYVSLDFIGGKPERISTRTQPVMNTRNPDFFLTCESRVCLPGGFVNLKVKDRTLPSALVPLSYPWYVQHGGPGSNLVLVSSQTQIPFGKFGIAWSHNIGRTTIDLDSRWYNSHWRQLQVSPVERHPLRLEGDTKEKGHIEVIVDMIDHRSFLARPWHFKPLELKGPVYHRIQLRAVVFKVEDAYLPYQLHADNANYMPNLYVQCRLGNQQENTRTTDVSYYTIGGQAEYNWRMAWWMLLPSLDVQPRLKVQLFDGTSSNSADSALCGSADLLIKGLLDDVVSNRRTVIKKKQLMYLSHPSYASVCVKVLMSLEVLTEEETSKKVCFFGPQGYSKKQDVDYILPHPKRNVPFSVFNPTANINYQIEQAVERIQASVVVYLLPFPFVPLLLQWVAGVEWYYYFIGGLLGLMIMLRIVMLEMASYQRRTAEAKALEREKEEAEALASGQPPTISREDRT